MIPSLWVPLLLSAVGSLEWSAPESCPSEATVRARVSGSTSEVHATVESREAGFELTVNIDGQVRTLLTPSCEEAADTTVFLIELASSKASPVRKVVGSPDSVRGQRAVTDAQPERSRGTRFHLSILGGAEWLLLPLPVPRFGASLLVDLRWVTLTFELRSAPTLRFGGAAPNQAGIDIAPSLDTQVGVCHFFVMGPVRAGPCVQAGLGAIWAGGVNVPIRREQVVAVWTLGPALRVGVQLGPVMELHLFASARFGPRPSYFFEGSPPALETNALGVDTGLGLGARW